MTTTRFVTSGLTLVAILLTSGCHAASDDGTVSDGGPTASGTGVAVEDLNEALCKHEVACLKLGTVEGCLRGIASLEGSDFNMPEALVDSIAAGRVIVDESFVLDCLDDIVNAGCFSDSEGVPAMAQFHSLACDAAFTGTVAKGDGCIHDYACADPGAYCDKDGECKGECKVGTRQCSRQTDCLEDGQTQASGKSCDIVTHKCKFDVLDGPGETVGAPCGFFHDCVQPYICDDDNKCADPNTPTALTCTSFSLTDNGATSDTCGGNRQCVPVGPDELHGGAGWAASGEPWKRTGGSGTFAVTECVAQTTMLGAPCTNVFGCGGYYSNYICEERPYAIDVSGTTFKWDTDEANLSMGTCVPRNGLPEEDETGNAPCTLVFPTPTNDPIVDEDVIVPVFGVCDSSTTYCNHVAGTGLAFKGECIPYKDEGDHCTTPEECGAPYYNVDCDEDEHVCVEKTSDQTTCEVP